LKVTKEIKTAVIALLAIALLVLGVNFLKGSSFFGGDEVYYAYFPNSGGLAPASSVVLNGVGVGKIISIKNVMTGPENRRVLIKFSIQNDDLKIPIGSTIEIGALDLFNKGLLLNLNPDISKGYIAKGGSMQGTVAVDMFSQVKAYADPVTARLQGMMEKVDRLVVSFSSFWDTTATSELQGSLQELKISLHRFGNLAEQAESLILEEKVTLGRILTNVESITTNLKRSNEEVNAIIGNTKKITDDMVTADFKTVVGDAQKAIQKFSAMIEGANNGEGSLGKLVKDETLYNELVKTNKDVQNLVVDLEANPQRYVHISLIGRKNKQLPLSNEEQKKLRNILDSIPN
jgi:phospholipid/cholesterol/gamma-HCH transport system substrate-binding protein